MLISVKSLEEGRRVPPLGFVKALCSLIQKVLKLQSYYHLACVVAICVLSSRQFRTLRLGDNL